MRIHVRKKRRGIDRITLNLASMIDVTFLLLIYFILTTVLAVPEDRLSPLLHVQQDAAGSLADFQPQIIEVRMMDGAPGYAVGGRVMRDRAELADVLHALPKSAGAFVQVFDHVPVGFAVTAVQVARDAGFEKVTYVPAR